MAIQSDIAESQIGIPFAGAYFRIVTAAVSRTRDAGKRHVVMIDLVGYAIKPQNDDTREIDFRRYHASLADVEAHAGNGFFAKCYAWVMAQPDMAGCKAV